jgi:hypothetical protein
VRRADLRDEPEVARIDHEQDRGHGLDGSPRTDEGDVEIVPPPACCRGRVVAVIQ